MNGVPNGVDPVGHAERVARCGLLQLAQPTHRLCVYLAQHGTVGGWALLREQLRQGGTAVPDPECELQAGATLGARLVIPSDSEWPASLHQLNAYTARPATAEQRGNGRDVGVPFALWVRGPLSLAAVTVRSAAVVGARAATEYGSWVAAELGAGLAERQTTVISGAAFGIDAAAHRGALAVGGATVAVLAGGVDVAYPRAHERLLGHIAADGLVVSEAPLTATPRRQTFLRRNRLIAALSGGVVLVEAGLRSGARNTMGHARALGRPRMAVPGPVSSPLSAGCHQALRADCEVRLVTGAGEVVEDIGRIGVDLAAVEASPAGLRDSLDVQARALLDVLPARAAWSLERIAGVLRRPSAVTLGTLGVLLDEGMVEATDGGYRLTARGRRPNGTSDGVVA